MQGDGSPAEGEVKHLVRPPLWLLPDEGAVVGRGGRAELADASTSDGEQQARQVGQVRQGVAERERVVGQQVVVRLRK